MPYVLSILTCLMILTTLACAQPAQDPQKQGQPGATPEAQHQPRREADNRPCEVYLRSETGTLVPGQVTKICSNNRGVPGVITTVQCTTNKGNLVFRPRLTGGAESSILSASLICTSQWQVGVLNGQPRIQSFTRNPTAPCPVGSCTIDFIVESVDGAQEATLLIVYEYE